MKRDDLRQALDISARRMANWIRAGLPRQAAPSGRGHDYDPGQVERWLIETGRAEAPADAPKGRPGRPAADPLLAGPVSPALEEYRRHRARLAELEVLEKEGRLIPREAIAPTLQRFANVMHQAIEALLRQYGADAAKIVDAALVDALDLVEKAAP